MREFLVNEMINLLMVLSLVSLIALTVLLFPVGLLPGVLVAGWLLKQACKLRKLIEPDFDCDDDSNVII